MEDGIFQSMTDQFVVKLGADLFKDVGQFITNISPLFAAGFGIYITIVALDAYSRGLDENAVDLAKRTAGWLIVIACAFNASQYSELAQMIYGMPDAVASSFGKNVDAKLFDSAAEKMDGISVAFDTARSNINGYGFRILSLLMLFYIVEVLCSLLAYLFLGVIFAYYVVAKILLALNLMIGPLFLGSMLFPATRQYGMNWIGQCLNCILTIAILSLLSGLEVNFFAQTVQSTFGGSSGNAEALATTGAAIAMLALFMTMTAVFILAAWKVPAMVSSLTGGASLEGTSAGIGRVLAGTSGAQKLNMLPDRTAARIRQMLTRSKGGGIRPRR